MSARGIVAKATGICVAALIGCGMGAAPAAGSEGALHIDSVDVRPGGAELAVTASNLPPNVVLDPTTVRVTADGSELPVKVTSQGRSKGPAKGEVRGVVLLVDASGSMESDLEAARRAALDYGRSVPADVRVGLVTFNQKPRLGLKPTTDRAALASALSTVRAGGDTSLYDAIRLGVSTLDGIGGSGQRRLVVLSDGEDTTSATSLGAVTAALSAGDVAADVVAFRYDVSGTSAPNRLAEASGGQVLTADNAEELPAAFAAIATWHTERALLSVEAPRELAGESVVVTVTVTAEGAAFSASERVTFPGGLAWWFSWWPDWSWQVWLLGGMTFVAVLLAVLLVFGFGRREDTGQSLLDQLARYGPKRKLAGPVQTQENSFARAAVGWTEEMLRARGWEEKVAERLDLAGLRTRAAEWTLLRVCICVILAGVLIMLGITFFVAAPLGAVLGWVGTLLFVKIRISRRRAAFADQLPDALQLVSGSLQSGFSLAQAMDAVVREDTQPIAGEISRALAETRLGVELEDALLRTAVRMASEDLKWIVIAIRIQREVGGNLAEVLRNTVSTMRERAQTRRQVRALSAEGRLSAYVLIGLPFAMAGYFLLVRAEYIRPLYTSFLGIVMLAGAAVFVAIGSFWMSKLVKVEV